jgi:hypothetical protein
VPLFHGEIRERQFAHELTHAGDLAFLVATFLTWRLALQGSQSAFEELLLPSVRRRRRDLVVAADFRHGPATFEDRQDNLSALLSRELRVARHQDQSPARIRAPRTFTGTGELRVAESSRISVCSSGGARNITHHKATNDCINVELDLPLGLGHHSLGEASGVSPYVTAEGICVVQVGFNQNWNIPGVYDFYFDVGLK